MADSIFIILTNRANILLKGLVDLISSANFYTEDPISVASMSVCWFLPWTLDKKWYPHDMMFT